MSWWLLLLTTLTISEAVRVDPRTGELFSNLRNRNNNLQTSSLNVHQVYAPAPRTEAPINRNAHLGNYQVTENVEEGNEYTPRPLPQIFYDPRIPVENRRPFPIIIRVRPEWDQVDSNSIDNTINNNRYQEQQREKDIQQYRRGYEKKVLYFNPTSWPATLHRFWNNYNKK